MRSSVAAELNFTAARIDERHWRRLTWILPAVVLTWVLVLWALGLVLKREPAPEAPKPIDATFIELPADVAAQEPPISKPPPPQPRPVPNVDRPRPVAPPTPEVSPPEAPLQEEPPTPSAAIVPVPPTASEPTPQSRAPSFSQTGRTGARAIFSPLPKIPDELRDRTSQTEALARFDIRADGTASVQLVQPTPDPTLNRVILQTLQSWRFFPAMDSGKPIASSQEVRIRLEVR